MTLDKLLLLGKKSMDQRVRKRIVIRLKRENQPVLRAVTRVTKATKMTRVTKVTKLTKMTKVTKLTKMTKRLTSKLLLKSPVNIPILTRI